VGVDQLSLPYRIGLVGLLVFAAVWFAVLKPKGDAGAAPAPAPGVNGLANDVAKAKGAADASNAATARVEAATGSETAQPGGSAAAPAPTPKAAAKKPSVAKAAAHAKDPSLGLLEAIKGGKVGVVLFWSKDGSDDRAARRTLRAVDRHHGKVVVRAVPVSRVGAWEAITRGVQVTQSPTILVIRDGKARSIVGFTEVGEVDQLVSDVGGKGFEAKAAFHLKGFAKVADDACRDYLFDLMQSADPPASLQEFSSFAATATRKLRAARTRMTAAKASTAADRALKRALVSYSDRHLALLASTRRQLAAAADPTPVLVALIQRETALRKPMHAAAKKARVRGCYRSE
jgi:hypothetical protein